MNDNGKTVLALLAGVVAGAALGILLAPRKGTDTIGIMSDTTRRFGDNVKSRVSDGVESMNQWREKITDRVTGGSMSETSATDGYTQGGRNI